MATGPRAVAAVRIICAWLARMSAWCQDWTDTALVTGILIIALLAGATSRVLAGRAGLARRIALICLDAILAAGALTLMWTLAARHTPIETVVTQMQAVAAGAPMLPWE